MAWNDTDKLKERFSFLCSSKDGDMSATDDPRVQLCAKCDTLVYEAASEAEFDSHARQGRCVSVVSQSGARLVAAPDDPGSAEPLSVPMMVGKVEPLEPPALPRKLRGKVKVTEPELAPELRMGGMPLPPEPELTPMARIKRWWRGLGLGD